MNLKAAAKELRKQSTEAEQIFWELVRNRRCAGLKLRRQVALQSAFVADFYCPELRLVIELDGEIHQTPEQADRDRNRDQSLISLGYTILRFTNRRILEKPEIVLSEIARTAEQIRVQESSPLARSRERGRG